jgi:subtilisin family serine protease
MHLKGRRQWGLAAAVVLLPLVHGGPRPNGVCVVVDPVVQLGCSATDTGAPSGATGAGRSSGPSALSASPPVRLSSSVPRFDPARLAVTFRRGSAARTIRQEVVGAGATIVAQVPHIDAYLLGVDPSHQAAALRALRSSALVRSASRELLSEAFDTIPDDRDWPYQQGLRVAGFPQAWDLTRGSSRIVVAVVDTGVDPTQPDLQGALVPGFDFVHMRAAANDDQGHGTAVAGVIAARGNNGEGGAGVCWRCSIMPVKVLDSTGTGDDTVIAAGIVWAVDHGAQVINLSLGGPGVSEDLTAAIGYAVAKGVLLVAAAGNDGDTSTFFPAADPRVLSVAATTAADQRYAWSNFGTWVDVAAPGCNVAPLLTGGYGNFCGTSSASPLVSGLLALELSAHPTLTSAQAAQALEGAAVPLPGVVRFGRIDAGRALTALGPVPTTTATTIFAGLVGRGGGQTYRLAVAGGRVAATLEFAGPRTLGLSLARAPGARPIAKVAGPSPLQLQATLRAGTVLVHVSSRGGGAATFTLTVTYPKPASA